MCGSNPTARAEHSRAPGKVGTDRFPVSKSCSRPHVEVADRLGPDPGGVAGEIRDRHLSKSTIFRPLGRPRRRWPCRPPPTHLVEDRRGGRVDRVDLVDLAADLGDGGADRVRPRHSSPDGAPPKDGEFVRAGGSSHRRRPRPGSVRGRCACGRLLRRRAQRCDREHLRPERGPDARPWASPVRPPAATAMSVAVTWEPPKTRASEVSL